MKFNFELSQEDIDYLIEAYERNLKEYNDNRDLNKNYQFAAGFINAFEYILNTLNQDIPGLTDRYKVQLGFIKE